MLSTQLAAAHAMSPLDLCAYISQQHYEPVCELMQQLQKLVEEGKYHAREYDAISMSALLFMTLKDEMDQVIRNDKLILFPLIGQLANNNDAELRHFPVKMIQKKNQKIVALLERLRASAHNFIVKSEWEEETRNFFEQLFVLHEMISQSIYLKENILLPAMAVHLRSEMREPE
ncbi:MAG TPA: hypothetical protein VLC98_05960 [Phnomibacter sp.]|nr:hypothetical protein [Phnomibacter sp.]